MRLTRTINNCDSKRSLKYNKGSAEEQEETQIEETPVAIYEPFNCWRCDAQSSFESCFANGRKEYCSNGKTIEFH